VRNTRRSKGNTLALVAAVSIIALVVIGFTVLYVSMLRSSSEHKSAIDAAAIAAAKDISRIVVDTPEWGYVGLTSEPPTGNDTRAADNWNQQVRSINELMATTRLEMIIASELGDTFMKNLALADLAAVQAAQNALTTEITQALTSGGQAKDAAGNNVTPYNSAQLSYIKNQAKNSSFVPGSFNLTLGGVQGGIPTSTRAPNPLSKGACAGLEAEGMYMSEVNIPFQGTNFMFGSVGKRVALCDVKKFATGVQTPAVVRAQATQRFQDQGKTWDVTFNACACAGSLESPRPNPGALTVSFPDGQLPEITNLGDVYGYTQLDASCPMNVFTSVNGDFPSDNSSGVSLSPYAASIPFSSPPFAAELVKLSLYDWIRCGGSTVNIDSVIAAQSIPFAAPATPTVMWKVEHPINPPTIVELGPVPTGIMHIYSIQQDGTIAYNSAEIKPAPYTVVGEGQLYAEVVDEGDISSSVPEWKIKNIPLPDIKGLPNTATVKGTQKYNLFIRDLARNLGKTQGGKHAGDRMDGNPQISRGVYGRQLANSVLLADDYLAFAGPTSFGESSINNNGTGNGTSGGSPGKGFPTMITRQDDFASSNIPEPTYYVYSKGPGGGAPRPAYTKTALAADIRFRRLIHAGDLDFLLGGNDFGFIGQMLP
jgi:hypothetical protein